MDSISTPRQRRSRGSAKEANEANDAGFRRQLAEVKMNWQPSDTVKKPEPVKQETDLFEEDEQELFEPFDTPSYINDQSPRQPYVMDIAAKAKVVNINDMKEEAEAFGKQISIIDESKPLSPSLTPKMKKKAIGHRSKEEEYKEDQKEHTGPVIGLKSKVAEESIPLKDLPIQKRRLSTIHLESANDVAKKHNIGLLKRGSICGQMLLDAKDDIEAKQRIMRTEMAQRTIQRESMSLYKMEAHKLAEEANHKLEINVADGNARDKLVHSLLIQSGKLVDLWEEAAELMEFVDVKNQEILDVKVKLQNKISERENLEENNSDLRNQISKLESNLQDINAKNDNKDSLLQTMNQNVADKKKWFSNLTATIQKVQKSQEILQGTMGNATSALSKAFENMDDIMASV